MHSLAHAFLTHPPYSQSSTSWAQDHDFSVFSPQKLFGGLAPFGYGVGNSIFPLSFGKSFMQILSAVPENGCLIFMHYHCGGQKKKTKKNRKKQAALLVGNPGWHLVAKNTEPAIDLIIPNQHAPISIFRDFSVFSPQKIIRGHSPHFRTALETPFFPLSFGKSFMKIRSAVPENGCLIFMHYRVANDKKKQKKSVKHICICDP